MGDVDLVLSGSGVKGTGLVGAITALTPATERSQTIFVDTTAYSATDFHLTLADRQELFNSALTAGNKLLGNGIGPDGSRAAT